MFARYFYAMCNPVILFVDVHLTGKLAWRMLTNNEEVS
jgi:hypothetical protein